MSGKVSLTLVQETLKGLVEPTVIVKGKWLTFKAIGSWAECSERFLAIKAAKTIPSLFFRGGTIGVRAEHVTVEKTPAKAPKAKEPTKAELTAMIAQLQAQLSA